MQRPPGGYSLRRMNPLATWKILAFVAGLMISIPCRAAAPAKELEDANGPNVRVMRHDDGSRTVFTRSPDERTLTKKKFSASGVLNMITIYRMDSNGNPTGCKIYDGQYQELYKVSYGYSRVNHWLVEERMFDSRVTRRDKDTGNEIPVQRIIYVYDAQGNRSAPIVINLLPGKKFEEVYGTKSSTFEKNPFKEGAPANPNAKPVGKGR